MDEYRASRVSIRKAIDELVKQGLLEKIQGSGTYIRQKTSVHLLNPLRSGIEDSLSLGQTISSDVIEFAVIRPPQEILSRLKIAEDERVYYIKRLRKMNERPQIIEESYMPVRLFPELTVRVLQSYNFV